MMEKNNFLLALVVFISFSTAERIDSSLTFYPPNDIDLDIQNIEYDGADALYIGATNYVIQMDVFNLQPRFSFKMGPQNDEPNCDPLNEKCFQDNSNIFLMLDSTNQQLIACGNVGQGTCYSLKSTNISTLIKKSDPENIEHLDRKLPDKRCKGIPYPNDQGANLFVVACDAPSVGSVSTHMNFLFSVRDLSPYSELFSLTFQDNIKQRWSFFKPVDMDEKQIKVVSVFTAGSFVYIVETGFLKLDNSRDVQTTRLGRYSRRDSELLFTYTEIPLTCKDSSGVEYPVASAVNLFREPPSGLKSHLGTPVSGRSEVVLGVFRKSSTKGTAAVGYESSIVCGFSIDEIDQMFKKVIQNCFNGIGQQGMGSGLLSSCEKFWREGLTDEKMLVKPYEDAKTSNLPMFSSYPDKVMGKAPGDLVTGREIMVYRDELLTGIAAMKVGDFANILLTTGQGKLKKVSFKQQNEAPNQYYEATIFPGQSPAIQSSVVFNPEKNFAVFFTRNQLAKMPIHDCLSHSTCGSCVSSGGPYCGWCTLQNKCTDQRDCESLRRGDENAWIRYEDKCIAIKEVTPQMVSMHYTEPTDHRTISLTVTKLPRPEGEERGMIYFCTFGGGEDFGGRDRTRFNLELGSSERGSCSVPMASNFLKEEPSGQAFITVTLSIVTEIGGQFLNLTSKQIQFYDCAALSNCIECTSSRFECDWCLSSGKCINSQLAGDLSVMTDSCVVNQRIIGAHNKSLSFLHQHYTVTQSSTAEAEDVKKGEQFCPQVRYPTKTPELLSFHVGLPQTSFVLAFENIPNLYGPGGDSNLVCVVEQQIANDPTSDKGSTSSPITRGRNTGNKYVQKIKAFPNDAIPDRVTCMAQNGLSIIGGHSNVNATVTLQWGLSELIADNPQHFTIELYNCSKLAGNCGECLSYIDPNFQCGFCQAPKAGFCTIQQQCDHTFITNKIDNVCMNPKIYTFYPQSGPQTGNTMINITGENLGRSIENIARVYIKTASEQIPCHVEVSLYMPAKSIVCRTSRIAKDAEGSIVVGITHGSSFEIESDVKFRFRSPKILDFNPQFGPYDGGTHVIVNGTDLDAGSKMLVTIAGYPCNVIERWSKWFMCVTGAAKTTSDSGRIRITIDEHYDEKSRANFQYKPNPIISKIKPDSTIEAGGILVEVSGKNLDVVQFPKIQILPPNGGSSTLVYSGATGSCKTNSSREMTCEMPEISRTFYEYQNLYKRSSRDAFLFKSNVGFIMDGVKTAGLGYFPVNVYRNPHFSSKNSTPEGVLILESRYEIPKFVYDASNITVNDKSCRKRMFDSDRQIRCDMDPELIGKSVTVRIRVGTSFNETFEISGVVDPPLIRIGFIEIKKDDLLSILFVTVFVAMVLFIVTIFLIVCSCAYCRRQKVTYTKERKRLFHQMTKLQEQFSNDNSRLLGSRPEYEESNITQQNIAPVNGFRRYVEKILFRDAESNTLSPFSAYDFMNEGYSPMSQMHPGSEASTALVDNIEMWLKDRAFLISIMDVLETSSQCSPQNRSQFVTLLMVAFMSQLKYITEVMAEMVRILVNDAYRFKRSPALLFRRAESMAEKLVFNWLVFTMYSEIKGENISRALYDLYSVVKTITEKGPVDQVTGRCFFTLNLDNVLAKSLEYSDEKMCVKYVWNSSTFQLEVPVYDSIHQLKEKILDAVFRNVPYSHPNRPKAHHYVLVVQSLVTHQEEVKEEMTDATIRGVTRVKKLLTVKDSLPRDDFYVYLRPRMYHETTTFNTGSLNGSPNVGGGVNGTMDPQFRQPGAYGEIMMTNGNATNNGFNNMYTDTQDRPDLIHLEDDANIGLLYPGDLDRENGGRFGRSGSSKKQLKTQEKQQAQVLKGLSQSADLNRIVYAMESTRGAIDKFFKEILYYEQESMVAFPIRYLFKIFKQCAEENRNTHDVKLWKSNCLISEFWVRMIQKPDNLLDVRSVSAVEHSLEVVAQTLMDTASYDRSKVRSPPKSTEENGRSLKQTNVFEKYVPEFNEYSTQFFRKCDDSRIPVLDSHMDAFLEGMRFDSANEQQQQQHHWDQMNLQQQQQFMQGSPSSQHSHMQASNFSNQWESRYKVNALKIIYDRFLLPNAQEIIETVRLLGPKDTDGGIRVDDEVFNSFISHFSPESGHSYSSSRSY
ncbi:plexin-A4-like isoform X4 [Symsagittifera roscoffensis]|uniref:plexin-A4-like isoform X4 n=1 Tax=Symsagittifera roscoffensis TaxID=84072 RepID=UPI00307C5EB9